MRKVKLLALLLAALMVVTAFAGCANTTEIEGEVDGLESRVEALEGAIGNVQGTVDGLKDSVAGIDSSIAGNNDAIKDVASVLEGLKDQIAELEKAPETQAPETQAPETQAPETQAPVVGDSVELLKKKADELGALIGGLQAEYMAEKEHYVADDYIAALQAMNAATAEIAASNTVAAMEAVYAALEAKLADYARVDAKFYNYYLELKGNYTGDDACIEKVEEALEWYDFADDEHYVDADGKPIAWTKYQTGKDENGKAVYEDLAALQAEMEGWEADLEDIIDEAERLVGLIEDLEIDATYVDLRNNIGTPYKAWAKKAAALAPVHVGLVTNYADYEKALAASEVYEDAMKELQLIRIDALDETTQTVDVNGQVELFDNYDKLVADGTALVYAMLDKDGETVATADVYKAIIDAIDAWAKDFELEAETVEFMINEAFATTAGDEYYYAKFLKSLAFVEDMAAKSVEFKDTLAKDIKALNNKRMSNVNETFVTAYEANAKAIEKWVKDSFTAYKAAYNAEFAADRTLASNTVVVAVNETAYKAVFEKNFKWMVLDAKLGKYCDDHKQYYFGAHPAGKCDALTTYTAGLNATGANANFALLYDFSAELENFLTETYVLAKAAAELINTNVANYKINNQVSIANLLKNIGGYHKDSPEAGVDAEGNPVTYNFLRAFTKAELTKYDAIVKDGILDADLINDGEGRPYNEGEALDGILDTDLKWDVSGIAYPVSGVDSLPAFVKYTDKDGDGYYTADKDELGITTIAEYLAAFGKKGALTGDADLSALVDVKAYESVVDALNARIVAIDVATAALNVAYDNVFGSKDEVILTTEDSAKVAALVDATKAWKKVGGRTDIVLAKVVGTVNGADEYELINVVNSYETLKANAATFEANIKKVETRMAALSSELVMLESLYKVLDTINGATPITLDKLAKAETNVAVTKLSKGAKDEDGNFKWSVSYVYFDQETGKFGVRSTEGCQNVNTEAEVLTKIAAGGVRTIYNGGTDLKTLNKTVEQLATALHGGAKAGATNAYMFNVTDLINLATNLYAKFMVNNYGVKVDSLENARANFVAEKSGYEFTGWVNSVINTLSASAVNFDKDAMMTVANLTDLENVLSAAKYGSAVRFGGYTVADMQAANDEFTLKVSNAAISSEAQFEALGLDEEIVKTVAGALVVEGIDVAPTTVWEP